MVRKKLKGLAEHSFFVRKQTDLIGLSENQDISYWYYLADSIPNDVDCFRILLELFRQKLNQSKSNYDLDRVIIKLEEKLGSYFLNDYFSNFIQKKFTKRD